MTKLTFQRRYLGVTAILTLMAVTIYFAFAFPIELFRPTHTDTTVLKSVQILVRHGDKAPSPGSYFLEEKESLIEPLDGFGQLTLAGKRRMYSLGKYLKTKYYDLLLSGDTNKIYVRSADSDRCIESASVLVSGLNPPTGRWIWSEELPNWQPTAIHTVPEMEDDLLYPYAPCPAADVEEERIRNSSQYIQYLNEYKHDLQTLYDYTGNDKVFTDLTQAEIINDALKARVGMPMEPIPAWFTPEFAKRLEYIADKTDEIRFSTPLIQRLRSGRLLNEIMQNIKTQIGSGGSTVASGLADRRNVQVYVAHDQTLIALMNSLQIYTGIPNYGSGSQNPDVVPEPVRINPPQCGNSIECDPMQFEQNVQHLTIDSKLWLQACRTGTSGQLITPEIDIIVPPVEPLIKPTDGSDGDSSSIQGDGSLSNGENADGLNLIVGPSIQPQPSIVDPGQFINQPTPSIVSPASSTNSSDIAENLLDTNGANGLTDSSSNDLPISSEKPAVVDDAGDDDDADDDEEEEDKTSNEISDAPISSAEESSGQQSTENIENTSNQFAMTTSRPTTSADENRNPTLEEQVETQTKPAEQTSAPPTSSEPPVISPVVAIDTITTTNEPNLSTLGSTTMVPELESSVSSSSSSSNSLEQQQIVEQNINKPVKNEDTNQLRPHNQIDNGIAISPMMKNLFKNGFNQVSDHHRGVRPSSITTRDIFVPPMNSESNGKGKDKGGEVKKVHEDVLLNELPLE